MSHGHLCLELGNGLKSNTDNDQQRRAAECDTAYARAGDKINDDREYGNDVKPGCISLIAPLFFLCLFATSTVFNFI